MDKSKVEAAVDDLVGSGPSTKPATKAPKAAAPAANKAAKPAATKAAAAPAKKPAPKAPAKPAPKAAAPAAKAASKPAAKAPAKPAPKAASKPKATANGGKAARGAGKYYFSPADREALGKELKQKVRKPITTSEYGATHNIPTWKVRLAAVTAGLKLQKVGASLTMHPAK